MPGVSFVAFPFDLQREGDEGFTRLRLTEHDDGRAEQETAIGR